MQGAGVPSDFDKGAVRFNMERGATAEGIDESVRRLAGL
ncbi:hypothetical protein FH063_003098 [Azospirillum argentinense]|uniref:Uncharacterized protein n=1 Tax=Azospirillum argentinense TaxID=2970906 RepID=A0A5B0KLT2_9PROT|nr:hypothetical protein FH063_003098 [Azospirillum argentinense]